MRLVLVACLLCAASRAHADDPTKARALFADGRTLIETADKLDAAAAAPVIAAACDKFAASLQLDPQLGTKLNLADCRTRQGKLADAYALFEDAVEEAERRHDREAFAKQQLAALRAKVVRVTIHIANPELGGLAIRVDDRELARKEWTLALTVPPGQVVVEASAPNHVPIHLEQTGAAGADLAIDVPALVAISGAVTAPVADEQTRGPSKLPYIVMGSGAGLLLASIVIGLHAKSRYTTARDAGLPVQSAQHEGNIGTAVAIAGAAAATVGVVLYLRRDRGDGATVTPTAGAGTVGLVLVAPF